MAKYSLEFKEMVVLEYLNQKGSYQHLSEKHGMPNKSMLLKWVSAYKEFGVEGLIRSRSKKSYSFDFKLSVVELYLTTEISYQKLALKVGMNDPTLVTRWVNDFRIAGPDALREKSKGRRPKMAKAKKADCMDKNEAYLKQLEDENLKLKIENAYLKELRRLRLEEERLSKKQELSAISEDYSD